MNDNLLVKRGRGRPKKSEPARIAWKRRFELAAKAGSTVAGIAGYCGVSEKTLRLRAADKYGCPLRETLDRLQQCGDAERLVAAQILATSTAAGSNAARDSFNPKKGSSNGVNIHIDARGRTVMQTPNMVIMDSKILEALPKDAFVLEDQDTGAGRLASPEETASIEDAGFAQLWLPKNGFEHPDLSVDEQRQLERRHEWTPADQKALDARLAKEASSA